MVKYASAWSGADPLKGGANAYSRHGGLGEGGGAKHGARGVIWKARHNKEITGDHRAGLSQGEGVRECGKDVSPARLLPSPKKPPPRFVPIVEARTEGGGP